MRGTRVATALLAPCLMAAALPAFGREIGFEERVRAQEAIERVYYAHREGGATKPFAEAVPRSLLEAKVLATLERSAALESIWRTPVTAGMLRGEVERMAAQTRMPERLRELFGALGNDPILIQECLGRQVLVERLTRSFFEGDERIHAAKRGAAESLRAKLARGGAPLPEARIVEIVEGSRSQAADGAGPFDRDPGRIFVSPAEYAKLQTTIGGAPGEPGPLLEEDGAFVFRARMSESPGSLRVATYAVKKRSWEEWWQHVRVGLDPGSVRSVAEAMPLPVLRGDSGSALAAVCDPDDTWDPGFPRNAPDARSQFSTVWTGTLMIVWGGVSATETNLQSGYRYDPATDTWSATKMLGAPSPRSRHTAVWTESRMVIWGGDSTGVIDTGGVYNPIADSWTPTSMTGAPAARADHSAIWTGSLMVVWGGAPALNDGGRYDPVANTWSPISVLGAPVGRIGHTAVWTGTKMVVWGGYGAGDPFYLDTGGRYDPEDDSWDPTTTEGAPSARTDHTAIWTGSAMVIWGGNGLGAATGTGGRYDPEADSWTATSESGAPQARYDHAAVWTGSTMIVWGGGNAGLPLATGGRYDPSSDSWTPTQTQNAPPGRTGPAGVWTGSVLVVWGGVRETERVASGGRYDPGTNTWTPTFADNSPTAREGSSAIWTGNVMVVWGGRSPTALLASGAKYDPTTDSWLPTATTGAPLARYHHTAVWTGLQMIVWGGITDAVRLNSGGRYDPAADTWTTIAASGAPLARDGHTAVWTGKWMVIWGGYAVGESPYLRSGARYDPARDLWKGVTNTGAPTSRIGHTAVWSGTEMIVWGGYGPDAPNYLDSGGRYNPASNTWKPVAGSGAPSGRDSHATVWTGTEMIVWGGYSNIGTDYPVTGGRYNPATNAWTDTSILDVPMGRYGHTAVWTGREMVIWGGLGADNTGGRYAPAEDHWEPTSQVNAPTWRAGHAAVWTGTFMIIWGGAGDVFRTTLGRYAIDHDTDEDGDSYSECGGDCNDGNPSVHPGVGEICDGLDNDCDGSIESFTGEDADGDNVDDGCDDCLGIANSDQKDSDADLRGDACDNCPFVANSGQEDLDEDGQGDACDLTITDPTAGALLDCSVGSTPPTILWEPYVFDRYKVFIGRDAAFATKISSGDKLLQVPSWTVPAAKWQSVCQGTGGSLYLRVKGVDLDVPTSNPSRKTVSAVVTVGKAP